MSGVQTRRAPRRYGTASFKEIAAELNVSATRVQYIERAALKKCRAWCEARGLTLDDLLVAAVAAPGARAANDALDGAGVEGEDVLIAED